MPPGANGYSPSVASFRPTEACLCTTFSYLHVLDLCAYHRAEIIALLEAGCGLPLILAGRRRLPTSSAAEGGFGSLIISCLSRSI